MIVLINTSPDELRFINSASNNDQDFSHHMQMEDSVDSQNNEKYRLQKIRNLACDLIVLWCTNSLGAHAYCSKIKDRFFSLNFQQECVDSEGLQHGFRTFESMVHILKNLDSSPLFMEFDLLIGLLD